jgi:hypothetical protein
MVDPKLRLRYCCKGAYLSWEVRGVFYACAEKRGAILSMCLRQRIFAGETLLATVR